MASGMPAAGARQNAAEAEKLLASAKHKAAIDGDPKGAIEDYKRAFAAAGNNRGLAAEALLRMAECHQQLGEAEAQAIYEAGDPRLRGSKGRRRAGARTRDRQESGYARERRSVGVVGLRRRRLRHDLTLTAGFSPTPTGRTALRSRCVT